MKKAIIILCALAVTVIGMTRLIPANIELEVEQSPPTTPTAICEASAEPKETTAPIVEITLVEPVCPEEAEVIATPEPVVIEEALQPTVAPPTAPPQSASPPVEQAESGIRTVDGQQQLYVPGFGWMEYNGDQSICIVVTSDGDINKMVGSMGGEPTDNCPNN